MKPTKPRVVVSQSARTLFALSLLTLLAVLTPPANAQQPSREMMAHLKRAVVIVTTYDDHGKPLLQGSGFFITAERIVTNLHVIHQASRIRVETFGGQTLPIVSVAATDVDSDLALLQIGAPCPGTDTLQLADAAPSEGDSITVLSNPQGSHWKTTRGRVGSMWLLAGTGRRLQITASLRPGSSGGPVLNQQGHVVAIAAMHMQSADELDFAVPAEHLRALQASASIAANHVK